MRKSYPFWFGVWFLDGGCEIGCGGLFSLICQLEVQKRYVPFCHCPCLVLVLTVAPLIIAVVEISMLKQNETD